MTVKQHGRPDEFATLVQVLWMDVLFRIDKEVRKLLIDYLKEHNISVYSLAGESGIPYSTINDMTNGRMNIKNYKAGDIPKIADALQISMNRLMNLCMGNTVIIAGGKSVPARIFAKNKSWYVEFTYEEKNYRFRLCNVNRENRKYVNDMARWQIEDTVEEQEWEKAKHELHANKKK